MSLIFTMTAHFDGSFFPAKDISPVMPLNFFTWDSALRTASRSFFRLPESPPVAWIACWVSIMASQVSAATSSGT